MRTIYLLCAIGLVLSLTSCQALMQGMAAAMYGYSSGANNASSGFWLLLDCLSKLETDSTDYHLDIKKLLDSAV